MLAGGVGVPWANGGVSHYVDEIEEVQSFIGNIAAAVALGERGGEELSGGSQGGGKFGDERRVIRTDAWAIQVHVQAIESMFGDDGDQLLDEGSARFFTQQHGITLQQIGVSRCRTAADG